MIFEWISRVYFFLYATSPFMGLVLLISLFVMKSEERMIAICSSILITFIGCIWISPIDLGTWGFGVFEYIFAIPFWFSIGVLLGKFIFYRSSLSETKKIPVLSFLLGFYVLMILLHFGYAKRARQQSSELIEGCLTGQVAESVLTNGGHHRRSEFNEIVKSRLQLEHISSQVPESNIRFLLNQGVNIYHCKNTPADLIDELLNEYEANQNNAGDSLGEKIKALSKNPNLRLDDYIRLAKLNPVSLGWIMLESPTFDQTKCKILKDQLETHLHQPDDSELKTSSNVETITLLLKRLDECMERKKTE
jgi:hypothetical protein